MKYHFVPQGYFAEKCPNIQSDEDWIVSELKER